MTANSDNARALLETVVRPMLAYLGQDYSTVASTAAEQVVLGTAMAESGLVRFVQMGGGPARGFWQMEPTTVAWLDQKLAEQRHWAYGQQLAQLFWPTIARGDQLACNPAIGVGYARLRYLVDPKPLPPAGDWLAIAGTWKRVFNTTAGAGTVEHFLAAIEPIRSFWEV